jgi:hypothetical protein
VANQKEFFGEGFKGDKTFPLIIFLAKWVYQLVRVDYFWSPIHGLYWYYFLYQASVDLLAFERDLKSEWVANMMAEPMQFVGMLTSLPMKS